MAMNYRYRHILSFDTYVTVTLMTEQNLLNLTERCCCRLIGRKLNFPEVGIEGFCRCDISLFCSIWEGNDAVLKIIKNHVGGNL